MFNVIGTQSQESIPTGFPSEPRHHPGPPWCHWGPFTWRSLQMPGSPQSQSTSILTQAREWDHLAGPTATTDLSSPHHCFWQLCGKEFNRMHNLMGHMHLHSDSKPFKCLYCPSKFTLKGNLTRHMKVKHGVMERGLHSQGNLSSRKHPRLLRPVDNKRELNLFLGGFTWGAIPIVEKGS